MKGWICLHRQLLDNWVWQSADTGYAWVDLLLLANYEDVKQRQGSKIVTYKKGTINRSISSLADRWGWSRGKARRFFDALQSDGMITVDSTTHGTTITIVNYSFFQDQRPTDGATDGQQADSRRTQTTNKQLKTNNNKRARANKFLDFFQRSDDLNAYLAQEVRDG